jgi:hypothetical protein
MINNFLKLSIGKVLICLSPTAGGPGETYINSSPNVNADFNLPVLADENLPVFPS